MLTNQVGQSAYIPYAPESSGGNRAEERRFFQEINLMSLILIEEIRDRCADKDQGCSELKPSRISLLPQWIGLIAKLYKSATEQERAVVEQKFRMRETKGEEWLIRIEAWLKDLTSKNNIFAPTSSSQLKTEQAFLRWKFPFERENTTEEIFYNSDGSRVRIEMMNMMVFDVKLERVKKNVYCLELPFHGKISLLFLTSERKKKSEGSDPSMEEMRDSLQALFQAFENLPPAEYRYGFFTSISVPKCSFQQSDLWKRTFPKIEWLPQSTGSASSEKEPESLLDTLVQEEISDTNFGINEEGEAPPPPPPRTSPLSPPLSLQRTSSLNSIYKYQFNKPFMALLFDRETHALLGLTHVDKLEGALVMSAEEAKVTTLFQHAVNSTAVDLYRELCAVKNSSHKNFIFFTPTLVAQLSMLHTRVTKEVKGELEQALHINEFGGEQWHKHFNSWTDGLQERANKLSEAMPTLEKANQEFYKFRLAHVVMHDAKETFEASSDLMHYHPEISAFNDPEEARRQANARIEAVTEGILSNVVGPLSSDLALLLVSAALFQGKWSYPFKKAKNSIEKFYNSDSTVVDVVMMNQGIDDLRMAYDYDKTTDTQMEILELPYHGDIALLLFKAKSPQALLEYMQPKTINALFDGYEDRFHKAHALSIGIPKVKIRDRIDLVKELGHLDWIQKLSFGMQKEAIPELISEVDFTMDEEGTTIAAASYSPSYNLSCDPEFKLHRPFGMAIVDLKSKAILGMGQVLTMEGI